VASVVDLAAEWGPDSAAPSAGARLRPAQDLERCAGKRCDIGRSWRSRLANSHPGTVARLEASLAGEWGRCLAAASEPGLAAASGRGLAAASEVDSAGESGTGDGCGVGAQVTAAASGASSAATSGAGSAVALEARSAAASTPQPASAGLTCLKK